MWKIVAAATVVVTALASAGCTPARFDNCKAVHAKYQGGIARPGARQVGMTTKYAPFVNQATYDANKGLDRDKDGVACEA